MLLQMMVAGVWGVVVEWGTKQGQPFRSIPIFEPEPRPMSDPTYSVTNNNPRRTTMTIMTTPEMQTKQTAADEFTAVVLGRINDSVQASTMSLKEIAGAVGLTPTRMGRKLRGTTVLTVVDVCAFADLFKLDVAKLVAV